MGDQMRAFLATAMLALSMTALGMPVDAHLANHRLDHTRHHDRVATVSSPPPLRQPDVSSYRNRESDQHAIVQNPTMCCALPAAHAAVRTGKRWFALVGRGIAHATTEIYQRVTQAAIAAGVPVNIAHAVVQMESGYRVDARSSAGAIGIMQVLPRTARAMGESPYTVDGNLRAGMRYLALALRSSSSLCVSASKYERGLNSRAGCTGYGRKVLALAR